MRVLPNLTDKNLIRARKVLFDIVTFLENEKIDYHLEGGTLLGLVRDKEMLPWDHDVDLSISADDSERFVKKRWKLYLMGYRVSIRRIYQDFGVLKKGQYRVFKIRRIIPSILKNFFKGAKRYTVDADIFVKSNDEQSTYWEAGYKIMRVDKKYYSNHEAIEYKGYKLRVPFEYENYLTDKYGDWKTPVQDWRCGENEKTIISDDVRI
jgi:phosphorylcholine metabolism protein LicD